MRRLLITTDTVGGVWQYATDLAGALAEHGIEPVLATMGPRPTAQQRAALAEGVELVETDLSLDWLATGPHEVTDAGEGIARLADVYRADIVQLNAPALAATVRFDQPVVAVAHSCVGSWWQAVRGGCMDGDLSWRAELTGAGLHAADRVVAPSGAFATMLQQCYDLPRPPVVVRNGRRPAGLPPSAQQDIGFTAGRLWDEGKNLATIDRAAALAASRIVAAGPLAGPNGTAIALDNVETLGSLSDHDIARRFAARPVFVSAALYEPFGLAALEAAQAGCALVLSDIPTFRELWDGAAWFVYPHDAAGFAHAIDTVIGDPELRSRLGEAARERAGDYTVDRMAAGMLALYRELPVRAAPELVAA
ncbi:glycosyltransferase [Sphingomonas sp. MAH-20]|uniref:Glycosyltransferase n=1 Tax=Sphingomonas horti TaxID=2682842 RepID=A0A6I4J882_9SPHN|nr:MULTISPECIES: glycosyltransferase family 4 protein [Sphingomonas]MBA2918988.1 glycosyltransferase family 4 protein [Sphingomonas sp. CGMCC 1.13658]MVO79021.1 glycosyltransferase [Sphingomonas horti]